MKRLLVRRSAVGLALGALAAAGMASIPAPAHAVIADPTVGASVNSYSEYYDDDVDHWVNCDETGVVDVDDSVVWSDNGVPVSRSVSAAGTYTDPNNAADKVNVSASGSATVSSTPFTGGTAPTTITGSAQATASAISQGASTKCDTNVNSEAGASGGLVLTQPMWVTLTVNGDGSGYGGVSFGGSDGGAQIAAGKRGSASASALIPAGEAYFYFSASASAEADGADEGSRSYAATFKIELQPLGSATVLTGKGKGYAQFAARDCATGNVTAAITKKAKKKAKQVLINVNGAKVAKLKGKKLKKRTLVLPAAPSSAAEVVATITLKNGKKVTVTRSYLACS
ncbi:hypothetical protein QI633_03025 [Nocardioides sp. QY071]|uniref:hypothetical protein n=1 Tax=Nocardioides sp. QY071 TaxID=3044187 RepID=UPI00249A0737|nr:hypothetical protein [Nocardioides sp. QY071]WGY02736.1 hypothetical protein QI633_03025 [Nocardioides sp. QY071]